jgi:hypothetical protein
MNKAEFARYSHEHFTQLNVSNIGYGCLTLLVSHLRSEDASMFCVHDYF